MNEQTLKAISSYLAKLDHSDLDQIATDSDIHASAIIKLLSYEDILQLSSFLVKTGERNED